MILCCEGKAQIAHTNSKLRVRNTAQNRRQYEILCEAASEIDIPGTAVVRKAKRFNLSSVLWS